MKQLLLLLLCTFSSLLIAQNITNINAKQFKSMIDKKDGILLDTRTSTEFSSGHIQGAILIDLQLSNVRNTLLALPKNKPLYLYCYTGSRSLSVANFLSQNGYSRIINLQRGIIDWTNNNYALVTKSNAPKTVQPDGVSIDTYKRVTSKGLVLVNFYAPWCAPCKKMMPVMDKLKREYAGKLQLLKVNFDASKALAKSVPVQTVPHILLFKNGKIVYSKSAAATESELKKIIDAHLN